MNDTAQRRLARLAGLIIAALLVCAIAAQMAAAFNTAGRVRSRRRGRRAVRSGTGCRRGQLDHHVTGRRAVRSGTGCRGDDVTGGRDPAGSRRPRVLPPQTHPPVPSPRRRTPTHGPRSSSRSRHCSSARSRGSRSTAADGPPGSRSKRSARVTRQTRCAAPLERSECRRERLRSQGVAPWPAVRDFPAPRLVREKARAFSPASPSR